MRILMPDELHLHDEYRVGQAKLPMYDDGKYVGFVVLAFGQNVYGEYDAIAEFCGGGMNE
jgi:hypothetical protein